jgi:hypothetical protein
MLRQSDPEAARALLESAQNDAIERWKHYEALAQMSTGAAASLAVGTKGEPQ